MTDTAPPDMSPPNSVVIERALDAPPALVWQMWTDPGRFASWYGPEGASIPTAEMDVTVGGRRLVCMEMQTPGGPMQMWFTGEYREIDEPHRLVYTEALADETGRMLTADEAGMPEGHPLVTEVSVELTDLDGRTAMVMTHAGIPADSPGATGWNMAIDKLADRLATAGS